jgi:hypothetical protein
MLCLFQGIENHLVLETCMQLAKRDNVVFIEGNHDTYLARWANDEEVRSRDFKKNTVPQLLRLIPTLMTSTQDKEKENENESERQRQKEQEANGQGQNEDNEREKENQGRQEGNEEKGKEKEKGGWKKAEEDPGLESLKRDVRIFFRKFAQLHFHGFKVKGEEEERDVLVTHGGLSCIPPNLSLVSQKV